MCTGCGSSNTMGRLRRKPMWVEPYNKPLGMIEYFTQKGWKYTGNCGACDHGMVYQNDSLPGWRLKLKGNQSGIIQQNQNPMNRNDFKNITMFDNSNYQEVYDKYFTNGNS